MNGAASLPERHGAVGGAEEVAQDEHHRHGHRYVGRYGGPLDSQVEEIDEHRGQDDVQTRAYEHCDHGAYRIARRPHYVVERECQVSQEQAREDVHHEVAGVGEGLLVGAEPRQHRVHAPGEERDVDQPDDDCQRKGVAEHYAGARLVAGSQEQADAGRRAGSHEGAEGGRDVHHRECDRQAGYRLLAYHLAYEYAVDDVVGLHHDHSRHGREGIFPQQPADTHCRQFAEPFEVRRLVVGCGCRCHRCIVAFR